MGDDVELMSDGEGLAVIGPPKAVERFLDSEGWLELSEELRLDRLSSVLSFGSAAADTAASISENTGRYLKLTRESAERVKELGLMPTKTKGISHAMLGDRGSISKWIQIEKGPASLLTNPAVLSGIGGMMAQVAQQQVAQEMKKLLVTIDSKLDDVRRRQRDEVLAEMGGISRAIKRAMSVKTHGGDRETAWKSVRAQGSAIGTLQDSALLALDALAAKVDDPKGVGALAKSMQEIESEAGVWIAVLARCFELQNRYDVLELDHVFDTSPTLLDRHRAGLEDDQQDRRNQIINRSQQLLIRLDEAGAVAQENVLLHARAARSVVDSTNAVGNAIDEFHRPLSIESQREALTSIRRRDAIRDRRQLRNAATEAGPKVAGVAAAAALAVAGVRLKKNDPRDSSGEEELESQ